jgi:hypothetical protein
MKRSFFSFPTLACRDGNGYQSWNLINFTLLLWAYLGRVCSPSPNGRPALLVATPIVRLPDLAHQPALHAC